MSVPYCNQCGTQNDAGALFCSNCGTRLPLSGTGDGQGASPTPLAPRSALSGASALPLGFVHPVLRALDDGDVMRVVMAFALRVVGVLTLVATVITIIGTLKFAFALQTEGTVGGLALAAALLCAALVVVQILFYRARQISELERTAFSVIPIMSILLRAMGEIYATLAVAVGIGGCVFMWLADLSPLAALGVFHGLFPAFAMANSFLGGLTFLVNLSLLAFFGLLGAYFLAESVVVLVEIAKHVRLVANHVEQGTA